MFITDPKDKRKPVKRDPWDYPQLSADETTREQRQQYIDELGARNAQVQPPPGQPLSVSLAPGRPGPQQPFYPAPVQAPQDPRAVTPHLASDLDRIRRYAALDYGPMGVPPEAFRNITSSEEAKVVADAYLEPLAPATSTPGSAAAAPAPAGAPIVESELLPKAPMPGQVVESKSLKPEAPLGETLHIPSRELKDAPRDRPAPAPTAPAAPALAPAPTSVFGEPTGDSELDDAISGNSVLKRLDAQDKLDKLRIEKRGGTTPELKARADKRAKTAEAQRTSVRKTYEDAKAEKKSAADKEDREAKNKLAKAKKAKDVQKIASGRTGVARTAFTAKDYDRAIQVAHDALNNPAYSGIPTTMREDLEDILSDAQAAKKAIETKKAAGETKKASAQLKLAERAEKFKASERTEAKAELSKRETALTKAKAALEAVIKEHGPQIETEKSEAGLAESREKVRKAEELVRKAEERVATSRNEVEALTSELMKLRTATGGLIAGETGQATGQAEPPTSQPVTQTGQATGQPAATTQPAYESLPENLQPVAAQYDSGPEGVKAAVEQLKTMPVADQQAFLQWLMDTGKMVRGQPEGS